MKVCARPGCTTLSTQSLCDACKRKKYADENQRKGSAASRGYGRRWTAFAAAYKRAYPRCGDRHSSAPETTHSRCRAEGRISAAEITDHIIPVSGPDDPSFYSKANLQSLCRSCDAAKRAAESRAGRSHW